MIYGSPDDLLFIYNKWIDVSKNSCGYLFFEQYASTNSSGPAIGFEQDCDKVIPLEAEANESANSLAFLNEFFVHTFGKKLNVMQPFSSAALDDVFCLCGLSNMSRILTKPSKACMNFFKRINFENLGIDEKMVRKLPLKDMIALCIWGVPASMIWVEAAIKITFGPFAPLFVRFYKFSSQTAFANRLRLWWENRM